MATLIKRHDAPRPEAMTIVEHLGELRKRLIVSVFAFCAAAVVVYVFYPTLLRFLIHPLCVATHKPANACYLTVLGPLDAFAIRLNVTAYGGLVVASPVILFELWRFVTPGLKANERRYAVPFAVSSLCLFLAGAFVAWATFPHALGFLHAVGGPNIKDLFTPQKYLGLILALMAIFGVTFEFPVVLIALELARVVTPRQLLRAWRYSTIAIVIFSGVITPSSDPFSMFALMIPLEAFYFFAIGVGKLLKR